MGKKIKLNIIKYFLLLSIYLAVFCIVLPNILETNIINFSTEEKYVLIVGDFKSKGSFGLSVLNGFESAIKKYGKTNLNFKYEKIDVDESILQNSSDNLFEQTKNSNNEIRNSLINYISSKNVVTIISANTSQTIKPCLDIGKIFNIPVIMTVATSDIIRNNYENIAFRLLPNNNSQADIICKWMNEHNKLDTSLFGILYSPTIYGKNLLEEIRRKNGFEKIAPFTISTTTDLVGTFRYGSDIKLDGWISFAYMNEAIEILIKKRRIDIKSPILFSDASYGYWFEELDSSKKINVFLSFPETYPNNKEPVENVKGFGVFGYDAFWIVNSCLKDGKANNKYEMLKKLSDYENSSNGELIRSYKFTDGENELSKFKIYKIDENLP